MATKSSKTSSGKSGKNGNGHATSSASGAGDEPEGAAAAGEDADDFDFEAPKDFEDVGIPDIDGWWKPTEGAKILGRVVGRTQIENDDGKMRDVVLIQLDKPCVAVMEEEEITLQPGQCIGVGVRAKLTDLLYYVQKKGRVFVRAEGKRNLKKGRTMWLFTVKGEKNKRADPPAPITRNSATDSTDDVDF